MPRSRSGLLLVTIALVAISGSLQAQQKGRGDRLRITATDLAEASGTANTAYDVIRTLRPAWLSPSRGRTATSALVDGAGRGGDFGDAAGGGAGVGSAKDVVVYIDEMRQQSIEDLKTIKAASVVDMRYLEQNRAVQMHGPGHELGAIEVTTVNKKK